LLVCQALLPAGEQQGIFNINIDLNNDKIKDMVEMIKSILKIILIFQVRVVQYQDI
jgi:hypothetical protein